MTHEKNAERNDVQSSLDEQGGFVVEFQAEWLDAVEDYAFQLRLRPKAGTAKDTTG